MYGGNGPAIRITEHVDEQHVISIGSRMQANKIRERLEARPEDRCLIGLRFEVAVEVKTTPTFSLVVDNWFDELKAEGRSDWLACSRVAVVSVVVSIQMRKMFAEVRKMFSTA